MLYVTTRDDRDAFTAHRALLDNRGSDGGLFLPFKTPDFTQAEIDALLDKSFNQCVADILNLLFNTKLTGFDLDFAIGRHPMRYHNIRHRIIVVETWNNPAGSFAYLVKSLTKLLSDQNIREPGDWAGIAVRIAVLFGIAAELRQCGLDQAVDVSVIGGDFAGPISVRYAKQWGLPIGNIICCCNENSGLWDLVCHGQMRTDLVGVPTRTPVADVALPVGLERLIYECGGIPEVRRYLETCRQGRVYSVSEEMLSKLRQGLYVSVVSGQRMMTTIPGVYRTHSYLLSPYGALAYAGLMDYRAKTGGTSPCLLLTERSPRCDRETVAAAMGIPAEEIDRYI